MHCSIEPRPLCEYITPLYIRINVYSTSSITQRLSRNRTAALNHDTTTKSQTHFNQPLNYLLLSYTQGTLTRFKPIYTFILRLAIPQSPTTMDMTPNMAVTESPIPLFDQLALTESPISRVPEEVLRTSK